MNDFDIYQALFNDDGTTVKHTTAVFLRIHCLLASLSWRIYAPYVNRRHAKPKVSFQSESRGNERNMCIMGMYVYVEIYVESDLYLYVQYHVYVQ